MRFKDEAEFNARLRSIMRSQGLHCLHVREADFPGPLDLIVWEGRLLIAWVELKISNEPVSVSQKEFMAANPSNSLVVRWRNEDRMDCYWPEDLATPFVGFTTPFIDWRGQLDLWIKTRWSQRNQARQADR